MASMMGAKGGVNGDMLAKIPPAQLREMREAFQVLDRDSDGQVNREDVVDILTNLGTVYLQR
jgi:Ca2+-binding EF-hand superfamily protein